MENLNIFEAQEAVNTAAQGMVDLVHTENPLALITAIHALDDCLQELSVKTCETRQVWIIKRDGMLYPRDLYFDEDSAQTAVSELHRYMPENAWELFPTTISIDTTVYNNG
jgi:hypothetical protein